MDELCVMLADKLGMAIDVSGEFLQTAVPQYAQMMALRLGLFSVVSLAAFIASIAALVFAFKKMGDSEEFAYAFFSLIFFVVVSGFVFWFCAPDALCWYFTPDAMLLKELVGTVVS